MGWSSGSDVAYPIIKAAKKHIKDDKVREQIYVALIDAFEEADCDTLYELKGIDPLFDQFFPEDEE